MQLVIGLKTHSSMSWFKQSTLNLPNLLRCQSSQAPKFNSKLSLTSQYRHNLPLSNINKKLDMQASRYTWWSLIYHRLNSNCFQCPNKICPSSTTKVSSKLCTTNNPKFQHYKLKSNSWSRTSMLKPKKTCKRDNSWTSWWSNTMKNTHFSDSCKRTTKCWNSNRLRSNRTSAKTKSLQHWKLSRRKLKIKRSRYSQRF